METVHACSAVLCRESGESNAQWPNSTITHNHLLSPACFSSSLRKRRQEKLFGTKSD